MLIDMLRLTTAEDADGDDADVVDHDDAGGVSGPYRWRSRKSGQVGDGMRRCWLI